MPESVERSDLPVGQQSKLQSAASSLKDGNEDLNAVVARVRTQVAAVVLLKVDDRLFALPYTNVGNLPRVEREHLSSAINETAREMLGADWVAIMRAEHAGKAFPSSAAALPDVVGTRVLDGACHSVWLHGKWRWLTQQMTTPEKEAFADAVDRYGDALADGEPRLPVDRWWRAPAEVGTPDHPEARDAEPEESR